MAWLHLLPFFFGGVLLMNAVPHLVSGVMGRAFQTPFAKPPGQGLSSSRVNILWGFGNLAIGYVLLRRGGDFSLDNVTDALAVGLGALLIGLFSAHHFGRFHGGNSSERR
jgi:hypothetical protein